MMASHEVDTAKPDTTAQSGPAHAMDGVVVLDLTRDVAGSYCTKLLADHGAEVIKVEPREGDAVRRAGPFKGDQPHPQRSGLFLHLNSNKETITINLQAAAGRRIVKELARRSQVMVESLGPGVLDHVGLSFSVLEDINPALVVTSLTRFGQTGPYRDFKAYEIQVYGMGGPMYGAGDPSREPVAAGNHVAMHQTGLAAAVATMMAFYRAEMTGKGEYIDISALETHLGSIDRRSGRLLAYQYTGVLGPRHLDHFGIASGPHPCRDGYINVLGAEFGFQKVFGMIGRGDLVQDPRFSTAEARARAENVEAFEEYFLPWLSQRTKREVWETAQAQEIPSGPINTSADLLADANLWERGMWAESYHPMAGGLTQPGRPFKMFRTPWALKTPAPVLGQHNQQVLCGWLGYSKAEMVKLREAGAV